MIVKMTLTAGWILGLLFLAPCGNAQAAKESAGQELVQRKYQEGEKISYHMAGKNDGWTYEIQGNGAVKKNDAGIFVEEFAWSKLISNGAEMPLSQASAEFRQQLSLDPRYANALPDFTRVSPALVGPMADLMTFYTDVWLAGKVGGFKHAGDHVYLPIGGANSWADGSRVIVGEDSIDFDITLLSVNQADGTAILQVRHVPPKEPKIKLLADWMKAPVADTPNNWVEVSKREDGKYEAEVGKETFDVAVKLSLANGEIRSVTMDNPVTATTRVCTDAALANCGESKPRQIQRHIELRLEK